MWKFFLNPNEMVASLRQRVRIYKSCPVVDKSKVGVFILLVSAVSARKQQTWCQATKPNQPCVRC